MADDTPTPGSNDPRPAPGGPVPDAGAPTSSGRASMLGGPLTELFRNTTAMEVRSATLRQVAERAERHLEGLMEALPWGIAVVRGDAVLTANTAAGRLLPGPQAGTLSLPDVARLAGEGRTAVAGARGAALRIQTRPLVWDEQDCLLLVIEKAPAPGEPAPVGTAPVGSPAGGPAPAAAPGEPAPRPASRRVGVSLTWNPVVEIASGRLAGFAADVAGPGDDPDALVQRAIVRAAGALADWGRNRSVVETPFAMVPVPAGATVDTGLAAFLEAVLRRAGAIPGRLWLRVPHALVSGAAAEALTALRRGGPRVALDSFARGGGDIDVLRAHPVDGVVLDDALVHDGDWAAVQTALSVARHLGLATMACGVRDRAAHDRLAALGCRWGTGPLYGAPADGMRAVLTGERPAAAG